MAYTMVIYGVWDIFPRNTMWNHRIEDRDFLMYFHWGDKTHQSHVLSHDFCHFLSTDSLRAPHSQDKDGQTRMVVP